MSLEIRAVVLLFHLLAMLFMAAPLYALITVNERARFAVPPNYNTDRYLENIIKRQPIRCYAYLAVILVTGILLTWARGWIWTDWALIVKLVAFTALTWLLSYVHFGIQPNIERILDRCNPGEEISAKDKPTLLAWRSRRKRLAGICLFLGTDIPHHGGKGHLGLRTVAGGSLYGSGGSLCLASVPYSRSLRLALRTQIKEI